MGRLDDTEDLGTGSSAGPALERDPTETLDLFVGAEPGAAPELPRLAAPGARLHVGRYELLRIVGRGGMGVVYEAHDPELDRRVALKLVREDLAESKEARDRLIREAQAAARLAHPHLIRIYDAGAIGRRFYVAMEWVDGLTLAAWLHRAPRTLAEKVEVFRQLASGLRAVHEAGLVHRDIKPSNLMVCRDGRALVLDFGLARAVRQPSDRGRAEEEKPEPGEPVPNLAASRLRGTHGYISPEQLRGERADPRIDQFAFGVVLYEALVGRHPFGVHVPSGPSTPEERISAVLGAIEGGPGEIEGSIARELPESLLQVLFRALAPRPEERFESMADLHEALVAIDASPATRPSPGPSAGGPGGADAEPDAGADAGAVPGAMGTGEAPRFPGWAWRVPARVLVVLVLGILAWDRAPDFFAPDPSEGPVSGPGSTPSDDIGSTRPAELEPLYVLLAGQRYEELQELAAAQVAAADREGQEVLAAEARLLLGSALVGLGDMASAEPLFDRALEQAWAAGADDLVARLATDMILFWVIRDDPERGEFWEGLAEAAVARLGQPPERLSRLLFARARLARLEGREDEALELLDRVLEIGTDDETLLRPTHSLLTSLRRSRGDLDQALFHAQALYGLYRRGYGDDSPRLLGIEAALGELEMMRGNLPGALEVVLRALDRAERLGIENPDLHSIRGDHGEILRRLGRLEEAEQVLERARDGADRALGSGEPGDGSAVSIQHAAILYAAARARLALARTRQERGAASSAVRELATEGIEVYLRIEEQLEVDRWREERLEAEAFLASLPAPPPGSPGSGTRGGP